jgi:hypothetical protein
MALGERFRSGGARGIARFLSDHQHCDVGFDVRREAGPGTGQLSITCKGCGESIAYKAAEAGELAAGPQVVNGETDVPEPAPAEPPSSTEEGLRRARRARRRTRGRGLTGLLPVIVIGILIAAGLVLIAIGVLRSGDDSDQGGPTAITPPEASAPAESAPPAGQQAPGVSLSRRDFENRFAIGVPAGWRASRGFSAIVIASPDGAAGIRVFLEPGGEPVGRLAAGAAGFLADDHSGAQIGDPQPLRLGPQRALTVTATYDDGEEVAAVLSWGGYRYLILRRVDGDASPEVSAQADAALRSFRAKR